MMNASDRPSANQRGAIAGPGVFSSLAAPASSGASQRLARGLPSAFGAVTTNATREPSGELPGDRRASALGGRTLESAGGCRSQVAVGEIQILLPVVGGERVPARPQVIADRGPDGPVG
jgi:hypothetical protein